MNAPARARRGARLALAIGFGAGALSCGPAGAVSVIVEFQDYVPACVHVAATDVSTGKSRSDDFSVTPPRGEYQVAVYPFDSGSSSGGKQVSLLVQGREHDCNGATVATAQAAAAFPDHGFNQVVMVLSAGDADGDGYVATGAAMPGTDCDDADPLVHPGAPERCNGIDDNCNGQIDEDCH